MGRGGGVRNGSSEGLIYILTGFVKEESAIVSVQIE